MYFERGKIGRNKSHEIYATKHMTMNELSNTYQLSFGTVEADIERDSMPYVE
jgi:hypothetical protein